MLKQKMGNLLLVAIVVITVVILASFLVIDTNRVTAQAYNNLSLFSKVDQEMSGPPPLTISEKQSVDLDMAYQGVYTDVVALEEAQSEVVGDLKSAVSGGLIGGQSTMSGAEYISPAAFRHDGYTGSASGYRFWPTSGYIRNNSSSVLCMAAPVYVPNGATLTQFAMYLMDNDPASNMGDYDAVHLWRENHASPGAAQMVTGFTVPSPTDTIIRRWYVPISHLVSNDYGYTISFCFNANTGLQQLVYGFDVIYDLP